MILFIAGLVLGVVISFFVLGLIAANDEEERRLEEQRIKMTDQPDIPIKCRGCQYQYFAGKPFDCAVCHEFANDH